ncbi:MAG: hypothetical protein WC346_01315 [Methanogenium sp.]|jgi:hypothetical protein
MSAKKKISADQKKTERTNRNQSQEKRVLDVFRKARGGWVSGTYFLHTMYLSQFHARIFGLENDGWNIEHSDFRDEYRFKSYRISKEEFKKHDSKDSK